MALAKILFVYCIIDLMHFIFFYVFDKEVFRKCYSIPIFFLDLIIMCIIFLLVSKGVIT